MVLPTTSEPTEPRQVVLPAEDVYWCVVDSRSLPRIVRSVRDIERSREALDAIFEEELPCAFEAVHAVYAATADGRVVGCAAPRSTLEAAVADHSLVVLPERVPADLGVSPDFDPKRLNLLTGPFEPPIIRRRRNRLLTASAVCWVLAIGVLFVGGQRRIADDRDMARVLNARTESLMRSVVGEQAAASGQPVFALFQSEWNQARRRAGQQEPEDTPADVTELFASLAAVWPDEPARRLRRLEVLPDRIVISAATDDAPASAAFASAFRDLDGWKPGLPSVTSTDAESLLSLELRPGGEGER
jgi:hypothetical protein